MDKRDQSLIELKERLRLRKDEIGIVSFKETPSGEISPDKLPCVLMEEGVDSIIEHSGRKKSGYPARRILEVSFECIVNSKSVSPRNFCKDVRRCLFLEKGSDTQININVAELSFIKENRMEGPFGYGLPNINGMKLILDLIYIDDGI